MPSQSKFPLFKPNRSQLSISSNKSEQRRQSFYDQSPIESPLHSPTTKSPGGHFEVGKEAPALLSSNKEEDSASAPASETNTGSRHRQPPTTTNPLQRCQSQRSPPSAPVNISHLDSKQAPQRPPGPQTNRLVKRNSPNLEAKKKRPFWGFRSNSSSWKSTAESPREQSSGGFARGVVPLRTTNEAVEREGQQSWQLSSQFPSPTVEEESEGDTVNLPLYRHSIVFPTNVAPSHPSSAPDDPSTQDHNYTHFRFPPFTTASSQHSSEQEGKAPVWERIGRGPHHRNLSDQQHQTLHPSQSATNASSSSKIRLDTGFAETPYPSNSRPPSRQSIEPPSPSSFSHGPFHQRSGSSQKSSFVEGSMVSSTQQHPSGRGSEAPQQNTQSGSRGEGQYGSTLSVNNQQGGSYRNTPQASPMVQENSRDGQGRSTPPPARSRDDLGNLDVQQLLSRHEELNDKYRKVKKYYFDKDAQVQQLQNTLAHQRLAQSRTSLDDNEYATRFSRLDGAINNLAFNIRKDWRAVPPWLAPYVNKDATTTVTKEMTAVGRACISRWLVDEIFDRHFHPSLEPRLSEQLKMIERNLRRFAPPTTTEEEREALLAKISNWRLASLDGLQDMLSTHEAIEHRAGLTKSLVDMLTSDLMLNLKDPPPPGLDAGVIGIIELAIGIASNLPLESRDVYVDYVMPETVVNESYMKVEGALPALINPGEGLSEPDKKSVEEKDEEDQGAKDQAPQPGKKKGMFGNLMGGSKKTGAAAAGRIGAVESPAPKEERVRFAAFMSVEVRGKNILIKAPVYV